MIAILGAMEVETALLLEQLERPQQEVRQGFALQRGELRGQPVVLATCGIGKVNAAKASTLLLAEGASAVIFTGVAGALDPELRPGDIVISSDCMQHDVDVTALGYEAAHIPGESLSWQADARLVELAAEAAGGLGVRVRTGRVLSGDIFMADPARARQLHADLAGSCVEMEGAAVAQVCAAAGVPFVIVRSISDRADGGAKPDFREFTELAARQSHEVVSRILETLMIAQAGE